jgi:GNAT superfamily N-acetyltransferase
MKIFEIKNGLYRISTDKELLDFDVIHQFLTGSYWSPGVPMEIVKRAAENSLTFGIYKEEEQVGYARLITDEATFAYLADVFVIESERGEGLSKWLVESILSVPELQGLRRWMLATKDAHRLYEKYGFVPLANPDLFLEINRPNIYQESKK